MASNPLLGTLKNTLPAGVFICILMTL